jgi:hypothetical protein
MGKGQIAQEDIARVSEKGPVSRDSRVALEADPGELRVKIALFGRLKKLYCSETLAKGCLKWLVRLA